MDLAARTEFRDQLLSQMVTSIHTHEKREYRRLGCLEGVEICRTLVSLEDFEKKILERQAEESRMRTLPKSEGSFEAIGATAAQRHSSNMCMIILKPLMR